MSFAKILVSHLHLLVILLKLPLFIIMHCVRMFWWPKKDVSMDVVLVTGAGSGIGKLIAMKFSKLGCRLILWDINKEAVEEAAEEIRDATGNEVRAFKVNLRDRESVYSLAAEMGPVDILVNNAGIVTGKKILDAPEESMVATMDVNAIAHFWTIKKFLPGMIEKDHGHVVTIASSAGHVGVSGLVDYCASKHAAVGIDESIRFELRKIKKFGVKTTCVNPYFISTGMFEGTRSKFQFLLPILTPDYVASKVVNAVLTNQEVLFLPRFLYVQYLFRFIMPVALFDELTEWLGASDSMDHFVGREKTK